jgi:hypothetical protein
MRVAGVLQVLELERLRKSAEAYLRGLQQEHQQLKTQQFKAGQALQALRQVCLMGSKVAASWALCCAGTASAWQQPRCT